MQAMAISDAKGLLTTISIVSYMMLLRFGEASCDVGDFSTHKLINISYTVL
jgi:hypothetical protein